MLRKQTGKETSVQLRRVPIINGYLGRGKNLDELSNKGENLIRLIWCDEIGELGSQKFEKEGRGKGGEDEVTCELDQKTIQVVYSKQRTDRRARSGSNHSEPEYQLHILTH